MAILDRLLLSLSKEGHLANVVFYASLFLLTVLATIKYVQKRLKLRCLDEIPGPPGYLFFGNIFDMFGSASDQFNIFHGKFCNYGEKISKVWLMGRPLVIVHHADTIEAVLSSQTLLTKGNEYEYSRDWLGQGLLTSTGSKWHKDRKLLTPAFHFKILEQFLEMINKKSQKFLEIMKKCPNEEYFDALPLITNFTLDSIVETSLGLKVNFQDESPEYIKSVETFLDVFQIQFGNPLLSSPILFSLLGYKKRQTQATETLVNFSNNAIKIKRKESENAKRSPQSADESHVEGQKRRLGLLDLLLKTAETEPSMTDQNIREQVDTFIFEGHDTTASGIAFSLLTIANHPEHQAKIQEELDSIFGESDRPVTSNDLREMKHLECCIKESLRLFPSVAMIARKAHEDIIIDGYKVPKGTSLWMAIYRLHKNPEFFPDPEKFMPERFLTENSAGRHPYAYVPFSAGPRNCIGQKFANMEIKTVISTLLREYSIESSQNYQELKTFGIVLKPEGGLNIKLIKRVEKA